MTIRRRDFIAALGTAAALPLAARAQQGKVPIIGYLGVNTAAIDLHRIPRFAQRLRELGWVEGRTIAVEYQWAEGRRERFREIAGDYVRRNIDLIFTNGGEAALAARQATSSIPIVFITSDPVGLGVVPSLTRPGGNITGLSMQGIDTAGKRVQLLQDAMPGLRRLAILATADTRLTALELPEVQSAACTLGIESALYEIRGVDDIAPAVEAMKGRSDAIYICVDPLTTANAVRINTLALGAHLPTMQNFRELVEAGGLISYGPNVSDLFRRAGELIDKILRGTKPADIPVEQPTKFDLVVNLITARALGLTIPESFLLRADELIQ